MQFFKQFFYPGGNNDVDLDHRALMWTIRTFKSKLFYNCPNNIATLVSLLSLSLLREMWNVFNKISIYLKSWPADNLLQGSNLPFDSKLLCQSSIYHLPVDFTQLLHILLDVLPAGIIPLDSNHFQCEAPVKLCR